MPICLPCTANQPSKQPIHCSIDQAINGWINQPINQSIYPSIHQSAIGLVLHRSICYSNQFQSIILQSSLYAWLSVQLFTCSELPRVIRNLLFFRAGMRSTVAICCVHCYIGFACGRSMWTTDVCFILFAVAVGRTSKGSKAVKLFHHAMSWQLIYCRLFLMDPGWHQPENEGFWMILRSVEPTNGLIPFPNLQQYKFVKMLCVVSVSHDDAIFPLFWILVWLARITVSRLTVQRSHFPQQRVALNFVQPHTWNIFVENTCVGTAEFNEARSMVCSEHNNVVYTVYFQSSRIFQNSMSPQTCNNLFVPARSLLLLHCNSQDHVLFFFCLDPWYLCYSFCNPCSHPKWGAFGSEGWKHFDKVWKIDKTL